MAPQNSDKEVFAFTRGTTRKATDWKMRGDEDAWKQQLLATMSALKANADMQAEAIDGLRRELRQAVATVSAKQGEVGDQDGPGASSTRRQL